MFVLKNFINASAIVLNLGFEIYKWLIIIRAVISWVNADPYNSFVNFLNRATEPFLYQIRKKLPINFGGLDVSPIIAFFIIVFLQEFLIKSLLNFAATL